MEAGDSIVKIRFKPWDEEVGEEAYVFKNSELTTDFDINEITYYLCLYEELYRNEDGTFQYNMLIIGGKDKVDWYGGWHDRLREISIRFTDATVEVKLRE